MYRKDKIKKLKVNLSIYPINKNHICCEDPDNINYNKYMMTKIIQSPNDKRQYKYLELDNSKIFKSLSVSLDTYKSARSNSSSSLL